MNAPDLILNILDGESQGQSRSFKGPTVGVGRRSQNDLVFDGPQSRIVSGTHCRFVLKGSAWWIEDLGSKNGTYLNQKRIQAAEQLEDQDLVELGRPRPSGAAPIRMTVRIALPGQSLDAGEPTIQAGGGGLGSADGTLIAGSGDLGATVAPTGMPADGLAEQTIVAGAGTAPAAPTPPDQGSTTSYPGGIAGVRAPDLAETRPGITPGDGDAGGVPPSNATPRASDVVIPPVVEDEFVTSAPFDGEATGLPLGSGAHDGSDATLVAGQGLAAETGGGDDMATIVPSSEPSRQDAPPASPAPPKAPAPAPAASAAPKAPVDLRAQIQLLAAKSRQLGEVSYRLDSLVREVVKDCLSDPDASSLGAIDGGPRVLELSAKKHELIESTERMRKELPAAKAALEARLAPLVEAAAAGARALKASQDEHESAKGAATDAAKSLDASAAELHASLREAIVPLGDAAPASGWHGGDTPRWDQWSSALEGAKRLIEGQRVELETQRKHARDRADELEGAESALAAAVASDKAASEAASEAEATRDKESAALDEELARATAELSEVQESLWEEGTALVKKELGNPSSYMVRFDGFTAARKLGGEVESLAAEVQELEQVLG